MLRLASYNMHKGVGLDRRRDPERILAVLKEVNADIVTLQEADRRFGDRAGALPRQLIDDLTDYQVADLAGLPMSLGWHGNAILVRRSITVSAADRIPLPVIEPRGAVRADVVIDGRPLRAVGMHLDISGLRRRQQVRSIMAHCRECQPALPTVLMGDLNEWSRTGGALREFGHDFRVLSPGASFHSRRPVAQLDRIVVSSGVEVLGCGVHHSAAAALASDHLPVWVDIRLPD